VRIVTTTDQSEVVSPDETDNQIAVGDILDKSVSEPITVVRPANDSLVSGNGNRTEAVSFAAADASSIVTFGGEAVIENGPGPAIKQETND
jgi:hypothetical protein